MADPSHVIRDLRIHAEVAREFRAASSLGSILTDRLRSRHSDNPGWTCSECSEPHRGKPWDCEACGQPVCVLCRRVGPHKTPGGEWCKGESAA